MSAEFVVVQVFETYQDVFLAVSVLATGFVVAVSIFAVIYKTLSSADSSS